MHNRVEQIHKKARESRSASKILEFFFFLHAKPEKLHFPQRMCPVCTVPLCSALLRKHGHIVQTLWLQLVRELSCLSDEVKGSLWRWNKTFQPFAIQMSPPNEAVYLEWVRCCLNGSEISQQRQQKTVKPRPLWVKRCKHDISINLQHEFTWIITITICSLNKFVWEALLLREFFFFLWIVLHSKSTSGFSCAGTEEAAETGWNKMPFLLFSRVITSSPK